MRHTRSITVIAVAGALFALSLTAPVAAHVGGTVGHVWSHHLLPLAKGVFFTKAQANERYISPNETTRKFVWRAPNDVDTSLTPIFDAWDLEISASCVTTEVHAEVDAVSEHGSLVGSFVNNFGEINLLRNTDWDISSGVVDLNGGANFSEAGGSFTYTSTSGSVVTVVYELTNAANDEGTECLVSGIVNRVP
jgi:hypothetical protein